MSVGRSIRRNKYDLIVGIILVLGLFSVYATLSARLERAPRRPFEHLNILFGIDTPRVIRDMTEPSADHYRTKVHPLYVLFANPTGTILTKTQILGPSTRDAVAIFLNSLFGTLSVLLAFLLFKQMSQNRSNSLLLSLVFAFSMSQLLLSIVPDTSSLATFSLLVTYSIFWISLYQREIPLVVWVIAGVFSLGVTTTNLIQTLICFTLVQFSSTRSSISIYQSIRRILLFVLSVLLTTAILAAIQKAIYPSSRLFFLPAAYSEDLEYASLLVFRQPFVVLAQLLKHFFVVNIVGAVPQIVDRGEEILTFSSSWRYSIYGYVALLAWASLVLIGLYFQKYRKYAWFYAGLAICLMFNLFFHSFYGAGEKRMIEYFLYTGNFTFLVITILLGGLLYVSCKLLRLGLISVLIGMATNNLLIIRHITLLYNGS